MRVMTRTLFGTDGIRGVAGTAPMRAEDAFELGRAATEHLRETGHPKPSWVVGMDPRISSEMLARAFTAGALARGADIHEAGVLPTPGVSFLTRHLGASAGVVISASHNPFHDNGLKLFNAKGEKLADEEELAIEARIARRGEGLEPVQGVDLGRVRPRNGEASAYHDFLVSHAPFLDDMRVGLDCANGAASLIAPEVFTKLGARLQVLHAKPDGVNINVECGSTHPQTMQDFVTNNELDVGITFDGDADRALLIDARGRIVSGDHVLAIVAHVRGDKAVVGTTMTNLGIERWLNSHGINLHRADVGDRYVHALLRSEGLRLGGEASGHVLFLDKAPTGDGILTALQTLSAVRASGRSLESWMNEIPVYPQILTSLPVPPDRKAAIAAAPELVEAVQAAEARLADAGRVNVRPSGTEPLVRIMVEGEDAARIEAEAATLKATVESLSAAIEPAK